MDKQDATPSVWPDATAIPDGVDGTGRLRLSVDLRPVIAPEESGLAFGDWPRLVPQLTFTIEASSDTKTWQTVPILVADSDFIENATIEASTRLWQSLFTTGLDASSGPHMNAFEIAARAWSDPDIGGGVPGEAMEAEDAAEETRFRAPDLRYSYTAVGDLVKAQVDYEIRWESAAAIMRQSPAATAMVTAALDGDPARLAQLNAAAAEPFDPVPPIHRWRVRASETFPTREHLQIMEARGEFAGAEAADLQGARKTSWDALRAPEESLAAALKGALPAEKADARAATFHAARVLGGLDKHYAPDKAGARAEVDEPPADPLADQVRRRLAGLQAHPTLRKFLRLILDVRIDADQLETACGRRGYLRVTAVGPAAPGIGSRKPTVTAFELHRTGTTASAFEPQTRVNSNLTSLSTLPLDRGVLRLTERGRFAVKSIDAVAAAQAFRSAAAATQESHDNGTRLEEIPTALPEIRSRGIMILDTGVHQAAEAEALREGELRQADPRVLFAEDLINGLRPAVVRPSDGKLFSPVARRVVYPLVYAAMGVPGFDPAGRPRVDVAHPYPDFAERDWGVVMPSARVIEEADDAGKPVVRLSHSEVLLTWSGEPMGIPSLNENGERLVELHATDLPVTCWIGPDATAKFPALRGGGRYKFMMLAVKPNGASVPLRQAQALVPQHALGAGTAVAATADASDEWFVYKFTERAQAPEILVPPGDRLIDLAAAKTPGESERTLVIRSNGHAPTRVERVLLAPATSLDRAEQLRQFDGPNFADRLKGVYRYVKVEQGGSFPPLLRRGQTAQDVKGGAAGRLFKLVPAPTTPARPHYVDPSTQYVGVQFRRGRDRPASYRTGDFTPAAFWNGDEPHADNVAPVFLQLRGTSARVGGTVKRGRRKLKTSGGELSAEELIVEIAEAEEVEFDLWCFGDPATWITQHRFLTRAVAPLLRVLLASPALLGALSGEQDPQPLTRDQVTAALRVLEHGETPDGDVAALIELLSTRAKALFATEHVPSLMARTSFKLVHAVQQPIHAPRFLYDGFRFVRVSDQSANPSFAEDGGDAGLRDEIGGTAAYAIGEIEFHRASTRELRFEAGWFDHGAPEAIVEVPGPDGARWVHRPPRRHVRPAIIAGIGRRDDREGADVINLETDDSGAPRRVRVLVDTGSLAADTIARRVAVRIVGESRFVDYFTADQGSFDRASATDRELWAALEADAPTSEKVATFWMLATARPPTLAVTAETIQRNIETRTFGTTTVANFRLLRRIWLGRQFFASGEGERVALLAMPQPSSGQSAPASIEAAVAARQISGWAAPYMTQWAGDPTLRSPGLNSDIPVAGAIQGEEEVRYDLELPPQSGAADPSSVTAYIFRPLFDGLRGEWYIDIGVDPQASYAAMLRLGLARYQPKALSGLELSPPIALEPFVAAAGWDVEAIRSPEAVEVKVSGAAYDQRAPAVLGLPLGDSQPVLVDLQATAHSPNLQFELVHRNNGLPVLDEGEPAAITLNGPTGGGAGRAVWQARLDIPEAARSAALRVVVTEVMVHANADAAHNPTSSGALIHIPSPFSVDIPV